MTTTTATAKLYNYLTGEYVRAATVAELAASITAANHNDGAGVIETDDVPRAYVLA